jgi:hypothetical protein
MAIYSPSGTGDDREAFQAIISNNSPNWPFNNVQIALFSQESGPAVTLRQTYTVPDSVVAAWSMGGGLVVATEGPAVGTRVYRLNGTTALRRYFASLEIIPQTICAMSPQVLPAITGSDTRKIVSGWAMLAIETYQDDNFQASRRMRFLRLDATLAPINGRLEQDPEFPTDTTKKVLRGEIISQAVTDGSITCNMVRTGVGDDLVGMIGGRPFQVKAEIFPIIEKVRLGDMTVAEFTEALGSAYVASAIPSPTGDIRFVSRASGQLHLRTKGGLTSSVFADERGPKTVLQAFQGFVSEVRVTYREALLDTDQEVSAIPVYAGGKPMEIDLGTILSSESAARSVGAANASWFGVPAPVTTETWTDITEGLGGDLAPAFFTAWQVGDLVTFDTYNASVGATITLYKIHRMAPAVDSRTVEVELIRLPTQRTIAGV